MKRKISLSIYKSIYLLIHLNLFFLLGCLLHAKLKATTRNGVTRKRSTKILKHIRNLFRKNLQIKGVY